MFSSEQRFQILKWGGLMLFALSLLPLLMHGLFLVVFFQFYVPVLLVGYGAYTFYSGVTSGRINKLTIRNTVKQWFVQKR